MSTDATTRRKWDPWVALQNRPDIELQWFDYDDPKLNGHSCGRRGNWLIGLSAHLDDVGQRCVLTHELIHIERGIVEGPRAIMKREERIVHDETARRLVPLVELLDVLAAHPDGVTCTDPKPIADAFAVTEQVATRALLMIRAVVTADECDWSERSNLPPGGDEARDQSVANTPFRAAAALS